MTLGCDAMQKQQTLECDMLDRGRTNFFRALKQIRQHEREAESSHGQRLILQALDPLTERIRTELAASSQRAGRKPEAIRILAGMAPETAAFLTIRKAMDTLAHDLLLQTVCVGIGREIFLEQRLAALQHADAETYATIQRRVASTPSRQAKVRALSRACTMPRASSPDASKAPDDSQTLFHIGHSLVQWLVQSTNLFTIARVPYKTVAAGLESTAYRLEPTPACHAWLDQHLEARAALCPDYLPCVVPPAPWTHLYRGGYHFLPQPLPLIKTNNPEHLAAVEAAFDSGTMHETTQAINAIQNTAWVINVRVLDVIEQLKAGSPTVQTDHLTALNFPCANATPLPPCPVCNARLDNENRKQHACFESMHADVRKPWARQAASIHASNRAAFSRYLALCKNVTIAQRFRHESHIYFPCQLDFRGRVYTLPSGLTPQGDDIAKGLLHFASAQPLATPDAVRWLAIHGANTFGVDKCSLDERHAWVIAHQQDIFAAAVKPLESTWWMQADAPFCFLAFCFEWATYREQGERFASRLPVAMDGTCNGLQIFSLLLKDEEGGRAVNLLPSSTPNDVYAVVAEQASAAIRNDLGARHDTRRTASNGRPLYSARQCAQALQGVSIDRTAAKRPVMILPYGGTQRACRTYTHAWLKEHNTEPANDHTYDLSLYLGTHLWRAMDSSVQAARKAMHFLQNTASVCSKARQPLHWTSPCGLPVVQAYRKPFTRPVVTRMGDTLVKLKLRHESDELDPRRQRQGISPNYVHSLDAAALTRTINRCLRHNINAYATIHDSYAVHAAHAATLACELREAFIELFDTSPSPLERLQQELAKQLSEKQRTQLPELPAMGSLPIQHLRKSTYFFA